MPAPTFNVALQFAARNTARLHLRTYQPGDGAMLLEVAQRNRAHLQRYESQNSLLQPKNVAEAEALVAEFTRAGQQGEYALIGGFVADGAEFVVQVYVGVVDRSLPEFIMGYFVDVAHEGQGYVTEAVRAVLDWLLDDLQAHRVSLRCSDTNARSARVAERCGFQREGHLREMRRDPDGTFSGAYLYGLLRSEVR